ncbi:DUF4102 domain-containing protein [Magnetovirga frankeli]|uniref:Arm DNA-binding domain-containing protein n=1 Tax=Magnetovirga frankeli TaxID=947516 RepID=UPI00129390FE|nr:DUF4102 domain-containing protein [gamma proteobacterium SS-5]
MALTAQQVKNAKPTDKPYKLADGEGLFLQVNPNGSKLWRLKYRFADKERLLSIGKYPDISLAEAREAKTKARKQLAENIDPSTAKRVEKAQIKEDSFAALAAEWQLRQAAKWTKDYAEEVRARIGHGAHPSDPAGGSPPPLHPGLP